jgi:hypothetical protein
LPLNYNEEEADDPWPVGRSQIKGITNFESLRHVWTFGDHAHCSQLALEEAEPEQSVGAGMVFTDAKCSQVALEPGSQSMWIADISGGRVLHIANTKEGAQLGTITAAGTSPSGHPLTLKAPRGVARAGGFVLVSNTGADTMSAFDPVSYHYIDDIPVPPGCLSPGKIAISPDEESFLVICAPDVVVLGRVPVLSAGPHAMSSSRAVAGLEQQRAGRAIGSCSLYYPTTATFSACGQAILVADSSHMIKILNLAGVLMASIPQVSSFKCVKSLSAADSSGQVVVGSNLMGTNGSGVEQPVRVLTIDQPTANDAAMIFQPGSNILPELQLICRQDSSFDLQCVCSRENTLVVLGSRHALVYCCEQQRPAKSAGFVRSD